MFSQYIPLIGDKIKLKQVFPNFFSKGSLSRNQKSYPPSNKIIQKTTIKNIFFLLLIIDTRKSSLSFKTTIKNT